MVVSWCRGAALSADAADDLAQEVLQAVYQHIGSFRRQRPGDSFRGWLWRITQNKIRDHFRAKAQHADSPGGTQFQKILGELPEPASLSDDMPTPDAEQRSLYQRVLELLQTEFEPRTMQAFLKIVIEGQSVEAVAAEPGMSKGAIDTAKSRVLARLRQEFGDLLS